MNRSIALLSCCAGALALPSPAWAQSLQDALASAYENNPTLTAQRANVRVADEGVPIARSAGLPQIEGSVTYRENVLQGEPSPSGFFSDPDRQLTAQLSAEVPIITFGAVRNSVRAAESRVVSSRYGLRSTESELFTAVVGAYMDVLRDEAVVQLNERNLSVMEFTLSETQQRRSAGNRGPTDVAQAEARVALAEAQVANARSQLIASREAFTRLVGMPPGDLMAPPPLPSLPQGPEAAVAMAFENNPELLAAKTELEAARFDVDAAIGQGRPSFSGIGGINQYDYLGSLRTNTGPRNGDQGTTAFVGVRLDVPIFQGGRISASIRQAQARQAVAAEQVVEAERMLVADARSAYAIWRFANVVTAAAERGVEANGRVLEGLRAETRAGFRPLLDRLNAEQELLNAEVTLVTARRDAYVAGFALLAAMGHAEARDLDFDAGVLYDPAISYEQSRDRVFQFSYDFEAEPLGTSTFDTPPQDASVEPLEELPVPAASN
ncbi:TolC family outer membrane protein [Aurantiacibacter zhengii]|uniref:Type I secretion protein TolC n=1 Tax=Aurantiacibacter zhengii TaxID=2307003 RepID=A0A418NUX9_9SPHN|nr:TolC family outer membrane protein [Aurantiacibacter zhengii]RIV87730.1 type I secretion protein TolC [Aurantiacibacter zhengii]